MEDVIKKIIKIEEKAQSIMASTYRENEVKRQVAADQIKQLEATIIGDAHRKIEEIREKELSENSELLKEKSDVCNSKLKKMEAIVLKNEDQWVDNLYNKILER